MKFLGQHFLRNPGVIEKIIASVGPVAGETVIEVGPGHGELTAALQKVCAQVIAIEKDKKLAEELRGRAEKEKWGNVKIIDGDALEILASPETMPPITTPEFKIIGNIPYYITGHLLRMISELAIKPERCVLMIQKEVAERIIVVAPKMNRLAASVQFWAEPKIVMRVPRADFSPPPEVDSAVISLKRRSQATIDPSRYYATVRALFAQPRKTILNNVADAIEKVASENVASKNVGAKDVKNKEAIEKILQTIAINPKNRPQDLSIDQIIQIAIEFF